jgi:hypothetical protein
LPTALNFRTVAMFVVIGIHARVKILCSQFVGTCVFCHRTQCHRRSSSLPYRFRVISVTLYAVKEAFILKELRMVEGYAR